MLKKLISNNTSTHGYIPLFDYAENRNCLKFEKKDNKIIVESNDPWDGIDFLNLGLIVEKNKKYRILAIVNKVHGMLKNISYHMEGFFSINSFSVDGISYQHQETNVMDNIDNLNKHKMIIEFNVTKDVPLNVRTITLQLNRSLNVYAKAKFEIYIKEI